MARFVHSFHINIGVGDSAIHLLVDNATPPKVYNAVLIDGGLKNVEVLEKLKICISWIETSGSYTIPAGVLQFDSVVVTHWDEDHWGGVRQLIRDGCRTALKENVDLQNIVTQSQSGDDKVSALEQDVSGFQCRYFKYTVDQPSGIFLPQANPRKAPKVRDRSQLLTTFYCPYLYGPQQYIGKTPRDKKLIDGSKVGTKTTHYTKFEETNIQMDGPFFVQNQCRLFVDGTRKNTLGARIVYNYTLGKGEAAEAKARVFRFLDLCKLSCEFEEYLGAELFSGWLPAPSVHATLKDPSLLIKNCMLKPTDGPRMFIVAGDQAIIGDTPLAEVAVLPSRTDIKLVKSHGGVVHTVDTHSGKLGTRQVTARFGSKPMNSPSIVCVVLSSLKDPGGIPAKGDPGAWKLWHYSGGDALWDVEGGVQDWLKGDNPTTVFMKLSHHGASDSTPVSLLDRLSPQYVITPAGEQGSFGHPRPEVLVYLDALDRSRKDRPDMQIYVLNWPVWIGDDPVAKGLHFSMANFDIFSGEPNENDPAQVFLTQLKLLSAQITKGGNILKQYWEDKYSAFDTVGPLPKKHSKTQAEKVKAAKQERIRAMNVLFSESWNGKLCLQEEIKTKNNQVAWVVAKTGDNPTVEVCPTDTYKPYRCVRLNLVVMDAPPQLAPNPGPSGPKMDIEESRKRKKTIDGEISGALIKQAKAPVDNGQTIGDALDADLIEDILDDDEEGGFTTKGEIDGKPPTVLADEDEDDTTGKGPADIEVIEKIESKVSSFEVVESKLADSQPGPTKSTSLGSKSPKDGEIIKSTMTGDKTTVTVLPVRLNTTTATAPNPAILATTMPTPFYLCGADYEPFNPGATQALLATGVFSDFIAGLRNGYIEVGSAPGLQDGPLTVHPADEWMQRLTRNGIGIQEVDLVGHLAGQSVQITEVKATVKFLGQTLTFSSNSAKLVAFPPPPSTTTPQISDAFLPDYNLMGLGLETNSTPFAIVDILSVFGMPWLKNTQGVFSLPGFDSIGALKATLDSTAGSRSSLSFKGDNAYPTWLRLKFVIGDLTFPATFKQTFHFLQDFTLDNACLVGLKKGTCVQDAVAGSISSQIGFETTITINTTSPLSIQAFIIFGNETTTFNIRFVGKNAEDNVSQVIEWMAQVVGLDATDKDQLDPKTLLSNTDTSSITLGVQQISLSLNNPGSGTGFSIQSASITFEVGVYGSLFNVELSWPPSRLRASLWTDIPADLDTYALLPYIETYNYFTPVNTPSGEVGLGQLGKTGTIPLPPDPLGLNLSITKLSFLASKDSNGDLTIQFNGALGSNKPTGTSVVPKLILGDLDLFLSYQTQAGYEIDLSTSILLIPRNFPDEGAGRISVSVDFTDSKSGVKNWEVIATAYDLKFSTLYYLFDSDSNDAVMDMLENFSIPELYIRWDYSSGDANLYITGALAIGPFELDMLYQYDNGGGEADKSSWTFEASLGTNQSDGYMLADLLKDLGADADVTNAIAEVPFVNKIEIPAATPTNGEDPPVKLHVSKEAGGVHIFWVQIAITTSDGTLSFTFVQYQGARKPNPGGDGTIAPKGYKRIIRVMLDKLPSIPSIPVVGQIDQPVDSIDYIWIGDSTIDATTGVPAGLTATEIGLINGTMTGDNKIPFKATKSDLQSSSPVNAGAVNKDPYVLLAGHHFIVVAEKVVVLDYIFGGKKTTPPPPAAVALKAGVGAKSSFAQPESKSTALAAIPSAKRPDMRVVLAEAPAEATQADSGATKGALKKSLGPLTIQSVGLQTKDGYLYLLIDATVALGAITLSVIGFGVGLPLNDFQLNNLKNIKPSDFKVIISGMSVDFNAPPVLIAGVFIKEVTTDYEAYKGGLAVSILPYALMAVGEYERTFSNDMKSVFVFGRLDGPLLTLEFAEISGVEVGFGYNYTLKSPEASDILNFPLVQGVTATDNPMDAIVNFGKYLSVAQDSIWFAIGMKVDSFQILSVDAAAIVQFGATSLKIAIVGIASASMPPNMKNRNEMFLYVELGIVASLDVFGGAITCQAQLTPNSFVLYPDCHLTGGFALCYWFGASPYAGDWVFTVGGYHPAFKPPTYYPVVPRVGINWNLSDCLTITGEAFFAVTPQMCMGGGSLDAIFSAGPVNAEFKAWASFLINFKPFYFIADIGVSVSVGFHIDIWIIHINIQVDISATLHLQGPPFGGVVHVDLWIHNFDIYFGDQNNVPDPLHWDAFLELVRQTRPAEDASLDGSSSALIVIALVEGSVPDQIATANGKTGAKWFVRAGSLKFRIECKVPLDDMSFGDGTNSQSWIQLEKTDPNAPKMQPSYARPMQVLKPLSSLLTVKVTPPPPAGSQDPKAPAVDDENPFRVTPILRNLPNAIWDEYSQNTDPTANGGNNNIGTLLTPASSPSGSTTQRVSGFTFASPKPRLPTDLVFPEFNATDAMSEGVFQDGSNNPSGSKNPLLPPNPGNVDDRPNLPQTPAAQNADLPAPFKTSAPFTELVTDWNAADEVGAQALADVWTAVLGWGKVIPGTTNVAALTAFEGLDAGKPEMLMADLPSFENWYAGCPFATAVA